MKSWVKFVNGQITEGPIGSDTQPDGFVEYEQVLDIEDPYAEHSVVIEMVNGKCRKTITTKATYVSDRRWSYPTIGDQLDMLWHAMDADPSRRLEPFYSSIKAVKDRFPKRPTT